MEVTAEKKLQDAATEGNAKLFQQLLHQHPFLVDKVSLACSSHTSLLHIAAAKGYLEIVTILLAEAPNMCWSRDANGMNPIHVAAMNGHVHVLQKLLEKAPFAAMEKLDRAETVLHLCVKHSRLSALEFLSKLGELVCAVDVDGETALHLAVRLRQVEMIRYLVKSTKIDSRSKNSKGQSPLHIVKQSIAFSGGDEAAMKIKRILEAEPYGRPAKSYEEVAEKGVSKKRDSLMVVAILIATMAFQAAVTPPGGVWQEDDDPFNRAGESVMAHNDVKRYRIFLNFNTVAFVTSLSTILLLLSGLSFRQKFLPWLLTVTMWVSITAVGAIYIVTVMVVTPNSEWGRLTKVTRNGMIAWAVVMSILLFRNTLRLLVWSLGTLGFRIKPLKTCCNNSPSDLTLHV